jgi:ATP-dependent DNA helicase RecG
VPRIGAESENELIEDEESDKQTHSLIELYEELAAGPLKEVRLEMLHGRLPAEDKERVMRLFSEGLIDVLISTTVIEVGVDVPNASLMIIMDADRFGVSQLHQLRGRVGRGAVPGLCLLVTNTDSGSSSMQRLEAVASTLDGFELSRIDLEQRREGDVLGRAQSGGRSHLRILRVVRDEELIERARDAAISLLRSDPKLENYPALWQAISALATAEHAKFMEKS